MDDLEESVGQRALTAALTAEQVALLEEAGVVDYLTGSLDDPDATDDDLLECMAPMLVDTAVAEDDDAGAALAAKVLSALRGLGGGSPEAPVAEKLLSAPVSMFALVAQDETAIVAETAKALGPARVNFNSTIGTQVNTLITEDDDSPEAMARRYKMQRRGEKRLKRDARREKVRGMMMEEFMRELTRDPVVLHWRGGSGGSSDILLKDVSMDMGGQLLLEDTSVTLVFGRKYGLVGRNGIGKTTFLKFLSAHRFEGVPPQLQILHIEQEVAATGLSILETVLATDIERAALLEEEAELLAEVAKDESTPEAAAAAAVPKDAEDEADEADRQTRLNEVIARLEEIDAHTAPGRAGTILSGLGFSSEMQTQPVSSFSGGWRMRVALARALFIAPDVLLLDEPTNHLDLHAVLWLETYLQSWQKTLVVVSHARSFLNSVCTDILHFQNKYKGDYDYFEGTKAEALRNNERQRDAQEKTRAHMQVFIDKYRANAKRAAMVQSRIKMLGKMETLSEILDDPSLRFNFPDPESLSSPVLQLIDVAGGYPGKPRLFSRVDLGLDMSSRVALVGPNGIGKSTLLKIILGELEAQAGNVTRASRLRMGRFSQHHVDQLDLNLTALESFQRRFPSAKPLEIRAHLGGMGLGDTKALQKMSTLSGGQKSRVAFAQIMWQRPHLLLLDEPTNHLDLDAVEALIHAIMNFEGGVLVVSHDEHLVKSICEELWVAEPGKVSIFKETRGNGTPFEEYRRQQLKLTKKGLGMMPAVKPAAGAKADDDDDDDEGKGAGADGAAKPKRAGGITFHKAGKQPAPVGVE